MALFITVNGPVGKASFTAESLAADTALPGHLVATGITDFPVSLPSGRVFLPNVWSFKAADLISYMAGQYEDTGPMDMIAALQAAEAQVEAAPPSEPEPAKTKRKSR